jgi:hypothetical protein
MALRHRFIQQIEAHWQGETRRTMLLLDWLILLGLGLLAVLVLLALVYPA